MTLSESIVICYRIRTENITRMDSSLRTVQKEIDRTNDLIKRLTTPKQPQRLLK